MGNRIARQVLLYAGVSVLILLYVAAVGSFGRRSKPVDNRGEPAAETIAKSPSAATEDLRSLTTRLSIAAAMLGLWIAADLLAVCTLSRIDPFIYYLIRALIGWGMFLALGAAMATGGHRVLAAAILFGVTALFVGFWAVMLAVRKRSLEAEEL